MNITISEPNRIVDITLLDDLFSIICNFYNCYFKNSNNQYIVSNHFFKLLAFGQISSERIYLVISKLSPRDGLCMNANGPAIWGGCVTRRKYRVESRFFSRGTVTVPGGYGTVFAVKVQILLRAGAIAVQACKWTIICLGTFKLVNGYRRSVAVQFVSEPAICHDAGI